MERTIIKGNKNLAAVLGVHFQTVQKWRRLRILDPATIAEYGRVILYDLDKVLQCLSDRKLKPGKKKKI